MSPYELAMLVISILGLVLNQFPRRWLPDDKPNWLDAGFALIAGKTIVIVMVVLLVVSLTPISLRASQILDEEFSIPGRLKCDGAGLSLKGQSKSRTLRFTAPSGMQIVDYGTREIRRSDHGATGDFNTVVDGDGHLRTVSVRISCDAEDIPGSAGEWNDTDLVGRTQPTWLAL